MKRLTPTKVDRLWRALDAVLECEEDVRQQPMRAQQALQQLRNNIALIQPR